LRGLTTKEKIRMCNMQQEILYSYQGCVER